MNSCTYAPSDADRDSRDVSQLGQWADRGFQAPPAAGLLVRSRPSTSTPARAYPRVAPAQGAARGPLCAPVRGAVGGAVAHTGFGGAARWTAPCGTRHGVCLSRRRPPTDAPGQLDG